ncbi:MAG: hypothetical protein HY608_04500 [Planctomycetes bacterium]|nr:hypothetical protein [Planctomycetota bacterium]
MRRRLPSLRLLRIPLLGSLLSWGPSPLSAETGGALEWTYRGVGGLREAVREARRTSRPVLLGISGSAQPG